MADLVAYDPLSSYLTGVRELLGDGDALVSRLASGARVSAAELNVVQDKLAARVPALLAAVEAALEVHALTALHRHAEPCSRHYASMFGRRECLDCKVVEWTGCDTCKDEFGSPAKPEDCKTRQVITRELLGKEDDGG